MATILRFVLLVLAAGSLAGWTRPVLQDPPPASATSPPPAKNGPENTSEVAPRLAVMELFTSEGCSSCPPADELLGTLESQVAPPGKKPDPSKRPLLVLPLSFHVDYWDRLGWPDRFAAAEYTQRQKAYQTAMKLPTMYTPQAVVNGHRDVVANQARPLLQLVKDAHVASVRVNATVPPRTAGDPVQLRVALSSYRDRLPGRLTVNAAITEDDLTTVCTRGENAGKTLKHHHVVRTFESRSVDTAQKDPITFAFVLPKDAKAERCRIVVYVQEAAAGTVVGGASVEIPKPLLVVLPEPGKAPAASQPKENAPGDPAKDAGRAERP
ncbi:MAG: DUF1223 domain-containing protein [Phycisphaerales bacterium]